MAFNPPGPSVAPAGPGGAPPPSSFADSDRIHFSRESGTWQYEDDDGNEFEYDAAKGAWVPLVDDELVRAQQAAYSVQGINEEEPAAPVLARDKKKRKAGEDGGPAGKRGKQQDGSAGEPRKSKNTSVYVTGLPPDTKYEELVERFGKFGVLEEDNNGDPKVKMYARENGEFNGEALVAYFKEESVTLAVSLLDEDDLRIGDSSTRMHVTKAQFEHKKVEEGKEVVRKKVDKKAATRRIIKMQKKLEDWADGDEFGPSIDPATEGPSLNQSRVVVLKHMFSLEDLKEDPSLLLELKEDVRVECESLGQVTNVVLFDAEEDGVMTVKFKDPISAQACVIKMNGRFFDGRTVVAYLFDGTERFQRAGKEYAGAESDQAEKERLEEFAQWLMEEGD